MEVQGSHGNWNYNEYMCAMLNGMIFALSIMEDNEPKYRDAPKVWLCDIKDEAVLDQLEEDNTHENN